MATRRQYGTTWWGAAWLAALEKVDDANRLPRGKSYANTGRVEQLSLAADPPGCIEAFVSGSAYYPYEVTVGMETHLGAGCQTTDRRHCRRPGFGCLTHGRRTPAWHRRSLPRARH